MSSYDGGKGGAGVAQWIINQIPPHATYIEAFLGNGAVMRAKRPAARNIGIEIDQAVLADLWNADQNPIGAWLLHGDALTFLEGYRWEGGEFLYCDPPYLLSVRSQQRPLYAHEFSTIEQHRALLTLLRRLPCMVAVSGYWSPLYELELAGQRSSQFTTVDRGGNRKEEWLWMNYPPPLELHDYRYLGSNFRERERIKRKKARWTQRLASMDGLERLCLMEAIGELRSTIATNGDSAGGIVSNGDIDERQGASIEMAIPAATTGNDDTRRRATPEIAMLEHKS